jgi:putative methionine-R-sulfoxide reductase with GAF domain
MSNGSSLDPELLQKLLESAFAVQECGMNARLLARIVDTQRTVKAGHLDVDATMHLVAECARELADASGAAVGRLKGEQLVYEAGSGNVASNVGRGVMATFIASTPNTTRLEILRVEDASTDSRIEAAICRQFGAQSLIILPIYQSGTVAGVLEVHFAEVHIFCEQEVRIYRLLAVLVGDAISQAVQAERKRIEEFESFAPEGVEIMPAPPREPDPPLVQVYGATALAPQELPREVETVEPYPVMTSKVESVPRRTKRRRPSSPSSSHPRIPYLPVYGSAMKPALVMASVLVLGSWILHRERPSALFQAPASQMDRSSPAEPANLPTATAASTKIATNHDSANNTLGLPEDDPAPVHSSSKRKSAEGTRVRHFGSDVTVRYFDARPVAMHTALREANERHLSDDVTVRYFGPRTVSAPVPASGDPQPVTR